MSKNFCFRILALFVFLWSFSAKAATTIEQIAGYYFLGLSPRAFQIDNTGNRHLIFGYNSIYYGFFNGSVWSFTVIDDLGGDGSSSILSQNLKVDSDGYVHLAYANSDSGVVYYATNKSGDWQTEAITDSSWFVDSYVALTLDNDDKAHIVFYDNSAPLEYATNVSESWVLEPIAGAENAEYLAIAVDSSDEVYVSYFDVDNSDLKSVVKSGGGWGSPTLLDGSLDDVGSYTAIAVDASNNLFISYLDISNNQLKYVESDSTLPFEPAVLDSSGTVTQSQSLTLDSLGLVHVSHYEEDGHNLRYVTNATGPFVASNAATTGDIGAYSAIATNASREPSIVYYDTDNKALKVTSQSSGVWSDGQNIISSETLNSTSANALGVDSSGNLHLSYYENNNKDLKYVTNASGQWLSQTLDSTGSVGSYSDLVVDSAGYIHISYFDATHKYLKYATNAPSGDWTTSVVDDGSGGGCVEGCEIAQSSSIAIDDDNLPRIAYADSSNERLKYATYNGSSWGIEFVDASDAPTTTTSTELNLVLDTAGKAHICYDLTTIGLGCRSNSTGTWGVEPVGAGFIDGPVALAKDNIGNLHIAYFKSVDGELSYATNASGDWVETLIASGVYVDMLSLAMDSSQRVYIGYDDSFASAENPLFKYATNASGSWVSTTIDHGVSNSAGVRGDTLYFSYQKINGALSVATIDLAAAVETETLCEDSLDNDGDTLVDCDDSDCASDAVCESPATPETLCGDGLDNDADSLADCLDSDCTSDAACEVVAVTTETLCQDGLDDDADSLVDCQDSDCAADTACQAAGDDDDDAPSENGGSGGGCGLMSSSSRATGWSTGMLMLTLTGLLVVKRRLQA